MKQILKMLVVLSVVLMLVGVVKGFQNPPEGPKIAFENHGVYYIGQKNSFAGIVLATAYKGQAIVPRNPEEIERDSIVVFDSGALGSPQAREHIGEALRKNCWMVSIGRDNSRLIELIFQSGVYSGPSDEEKKRTFIGQFNAPAVGFRLVRDGDHEYPSYFVSNTDNPHEIMKGIRAWVTGELLGR